LQAEREALVARAAREEARREAADDAGRGARLRAALRGSEADQARADRGRVRARLELTTRSRARATTPAKRRSDPPAAALRTSLIGRTVTVCPPTRRTSGRARGAARR